jgi:hypothetical protein
MKPLIDNEGFRKALDIYIETTKYGPADEINLDVGDTRGLFTSGRCALTLDWGDIGTLAIDPKTSKVADKVGAVIIPGSKQVIDRASGKLVDCTPELCPYAIDGVNHAPFAAFGGWSGAIKRHGFHRQRKTHGQTDRHRAPGAVGAGTTPGRTFRGHKMAGQMGGDRVTVANLLVIAADPDRNLLAVRGAIPGNRGGLVVISGV